MWGRPRCLQATCGVVQCSQAEAIRCRRRCHQVPIGHLAAIPLRRHVHVINREAAKAPQRLGQLRVKCERVSTRRHLHSDRFQLIAVDCGHVPRLQRRARSRHGWLRHYHRREWHAAVHPCPPKHGVRQANLACVRAVRGQHDIVGPHERSGRRGRRWRAARWRRWRWRATRWRRWR